MRPLKIVFSALLLAIFAMSSCSEDKITDGATGTLTGTVVAEGTNEPLQNVKISTQPISTTVFTNSEGFFQIEEIDVQDYSVQAELDGYITTFEPASITANRTANVIFEMQIEQEDNAAPNTPVLIAPANNAQDLDLTVEFIWSGSDPDGDELTYTLSLLNDQNDLLETYTAVGDTMLTVNDGLLFATKYFWQVSANDGVNSDVLSTISSFETTNTPNLEFLFVRKVGDNNVIFASDEDGNTLQLTDADKNSWRPRKNATTGKIAYLQSVGADAQLFVMNTDGSGKNQLSNSFPVAGFNLDEIDIAWTPDGGSILYPNFNKIYRVNIDGSGTAVFYTTTDGSFVSEVDWSEFNDVIAVKTNDVQGYNARIFTMQPDGTVINVVQEGLPGAVGGLDLNIDGSELLFAYDISGLELPSYRPQDSRLFIYYSDTDTSAQLSTQVEDGFINIDPRFSPNENLVIYTQKGRALNALRTIYSHDIEFDNPNEEELFPNSFMPDWEEN